MVSPQVGRNVSSALSRSPAWPRVIDVPPLREQDVLQLGVPVGDALRVAVLDFEVVDVEPAEDTVRHARRVDHGVLGAKPFGIGWVPGPCNGVATEDAGCPWVPVPR